MQIAAVNWQPKWHHKRRVATYEINAGNVADACARALADFYRPDRLWTPTTCAELAQSRAAWIASEGFDVLASHHDSRTGRALWARPEGTALAVYET